MNIEHDDFWDRRYDEIFVKDPQYLQAIPTPSFYVAKKRLCYYSWDHGRYAV
ncbi:MAG: hypothetical protein ABSB22_23685 [Thermodesulfobacteriota bacterium]|jgi:DNA modification methylase